MALWYNTIPYPRVLVGVLVLRRARVEPSSSQKDAFLCEDGPTRNFGGDRLLASQQCFWMNNGPMIDCIKLIEEVWYGTIPPSVHNAFLDTISVLLPSVWSPFLLLPYKSKIVLSLRLQRYLHRHCRIRHCHFS